MQASLHMKFLKCLAAQRLKSDLVPPSPCLQNCFWISVSAKNLVHSQLLPRSTSFVDWWPGYQQIISENSGVWTCPADPCCEFLDLGLEEEAARCFTSPKTWGASGSISKPWQWRCTASARAQARAEVISAARKPVMNCAMRKLELRLQQLPCTTSWFQRRKLPALIGIRLKPSSETVNFRNFDAVNAKTQPKHLKPSIVFCQKRLDRLDSWWIGSKFENLKLPPPAARRSTQLSCGPLWAKLLSNSPRASSQGLKLRWKPGTTRVPPSWTNRLIWQVSFWERVQVGTTCVDIETLVGPGVRFHHK